MWSETTKFWMNRNVLYNYELRGKNGLTLTSYAPHECGLILYSLMVLYVQKQMIEAHSKIKFKDTCIRTSYEDTEATS